MRKCLNHISRNLHGRITLSELAEHCGLSRGHLSRLFRGSVGCSVSRYVIRRKLEAAKAMLAGAYTVGEVAYLLGFFLGEPFHQALSGGIRRDACPLAA